MAINAALVKYVTLKHIFINIIISNLEVGVVMDKLKKPVF